MIIQVREKRAGRIEEEGSDFMAGGEVPEERIVAERRLRPRRGYSAEVMTWVGGGEVEDLGVDYRMVASTTGMIESIAIIPIRLAYFSGLSLTISSSLDPFWT